MKIDDILAGTDTVMTDDLIRLFKYAGCDPHCHACNKPIEAGKTFKLLSHTSAPGWQPGIGPIDEMCCEKCGQPELLKRDKRREKEAQDRHYSRKPSGSGGGYSRPSKT